VQSVHIVVITGLSGSGKSTAIRALEDLGYFCVDNLPVVLLPQFLELNQRLTPATPRIGLVIDARERHFLPKAEAIFNDLRAQGYPIEIVFLEADVEVLVRRYSETRRKHPLAPDGPIRDGIQAEQDQLTDLRHLAAHTLDTTAMTVHDLRRAIQDLYHAPLPHQRALTLNVMSFGFRHGVPVEADLVFDIRFLQNPHFVPALRHKTGLEPEVEAYVLSQADAQTFLRHLYGLLDFVLPLYRAEGKTYLTIAIGCTGGQHRSVALARRLGAHLSDLSYPVNLRHRDLEPMADPPSVG
jgi:UPF0042 nucleotide-binding protein